MMLSPKTQNSPGGTKTRRHLLAKPSRYGVMERIGIVLIASGVSKSCDRDGCTFSIKTIGVYPTQPYLISKPI
jgi:hypothetical protein